MIYRVWWQIGDNPLQMEDFGSDLKAARKKYEDCLEWADYVRLNYQFNITTPAETIDEMGFIRPVRKKNG